MVMVRPRSGRHPKQQFSHAALQRNVVINPILYGLRGLKDGIGYSFFGIIPELI